MLSNSENLQSQADQAAQKFLNFKKIQKVPKDSKKIPKDSKRFQKNPKDLKQIQKNPKYS